MKHDLRPLSGYNPSMLRLTRQVRFAVNAAPDDQRRTNPSNTFGGYPTLTGLGHYFTLDLTLGGDLDPSTGYLQNIKRIDALARELAIPVIDAAARTGRLGGGAKTLLRLLDSLRDPWPNVALLSLRLSLSPLLSIAIHNREFPMVRLSQRFEFCAAHRLFNPALTDEQNLATFGKCSNPHGHGHNYELEVTLAGHPDDNGLLIDIPAFERIVKQTVIDRFDHRNLNAELPEFVHTPPTVENIAATIYHLLKPHLSTPKTHLASVTVWETARTCCEYSEE